MFERILVPLDGSPTAEAALSLIDPLLHLKNAAVHLLTVVPVNVVEGTPLDGGAIRVAGQAARIYADGKVARLRQAGVEAACHVRYGAAADEILKFSAAGDTQLIALTTHGRSGISRLMMGSVAERVLRSSGAPILVRKSSETPAPSDRRPFRNIFIPLDGTPESEAILPYAMMLANAYGAEVHTTIVLHSEEAVSESLAPGSTEDYLDQVCDRFRKAGASASSVIGRGDPVSVLREMIRDGQPDLVAMTTHGRAGLGRWILGSVTEALLRSVTAPLLVIHAPAVRAAQPQLAEERVA